MLFSAFMVCLFLVIFSFARFIVDICAGIDDDHDFLGGAYVSPLSAGSLHFYAYLQKELAKSGREVGIAVLAYSGYRLSFY